MISSLFLIFFISVGISAPIENPKEKYILNLKKYVEKEKKSYELKSQQKRTILEELDKLNREQYEIRKQIKVIKDSFDEMDMAFNNLVLEHENHKKLVEYQKRKLISLLKLAYKIKKEGVLGFFDGKNVQEVMSRMKTVFRMFKSHSEETKRINEKVTRIAESEEKILQMKREKEALWEKLKLNEYRLIKLLDEKNRVLRKINMSQKAFLEASRQLQKISSEVANLFHSFEKDDGILNLKFFTLPVSSGKVVKHFGKFVNKKFKTVVFQKGLEIETDISVPVYAVMGGVVAYDGWIKGLGNVIIIHHGDGLYTLNAHLGNILLKTGDEVKEGQIVGETGDTGNSSKPGLYFEVRKNKKALDPIAYFSPDSLKNLIF